MSKRLPISSRIVVGLIRGYQYLLSPFLGSTCRHSPSCSAYAVEALERHGLRRGIWLTVRRLGRCHPWHPGGIDLVPGAPATAGGADDPN